MLRMKKRRRQLPREPPWRGGEKTPLPTPKEEGTHFFVQPSRVLGPGHRRHDWPRIALKKTSRAKSDSQRRKRPENDENKKTSLDVLDHVSRSKLVHIGEYVDNYLGRLVDELLRNGQRRCQADNVVVRRLAEDSAMSQSQANLPKSTPEMRMLRTVPWKDSSYQALRVASGTTSMAFIRPFPRTSATYGRSLIAAIRSRKRSPMAREFWISFSSRRIAKAYM